MKIGVIGHGFVGRSVASYFSEAHDVRTYDNATDAPRTFVDVCKHSSLMFVCVPTPMAPDGSCHTGIVEYVLHGIKQNCDPEWTVIVIKSTLPPGFTERARRETGLRVIFSPEFLTEKNAAKDFAEANRMIIGGPKEDAEVLMLALRESKHPAKCHVVRPAEAELCKLYTNAFLFTKVLLANEIAQICAALDINYDKVREITALDPRVGSSHMQVPGHDGLRGAGGHCFPKDMENLRAVARALNLNEKLFTAVLERNRELREDLDWERMKGRAVL